MKRVFGLVGYACNGKSTIIKKIINNKDYTFIDLPAIYKSEASKRGYAGVTEWYTGVGLKKYKETSVKAVCDYIDRILPRNENIIIDDIFDIDIYNKLIKIFPQMKLIAFHSKYNDRLYRLSIRTGFTEHDVLVDGLKKRDNMKRYCGIEDIFPHCKYEITNQSDIESAKKRFHEDINKCLVMAIVGFSGSGKSTICNYVGEMLNIPIFKYGKEITKIVNKHGYKRSRDYIKDNGIDNYIELTNKEIMTPLKKFMDSNKFFIIDGIVSNEVYEKIRKKNEIFSIYIKLHEDERIKRIMKRELGK